jgi:hypothetical protein
MKNFLANRTTISVLMIIQIIPLVIFPPSTYSFNNQEWWLAFMLAILALVGGVQILRRSIASWPWYLVNFAQGFNLISRLMMLFPHAILNVEGKQIFNSLYVVLSVIAMLFSSFMIWYCDKPETRLGLLREN